MRVLRENFLMTPSEMCFVQYMPVKTPNGGVSIPRNLDWARPMVEFVAGDPWYGRYTDHYVYLTAKHLWVDSSNPGNRKGWHIDGFLSDDSNYVWCDRNPTEYIPYTDGLMFEQDHEKSLLQMEGFSGNSLIQEIPLNSVVDMERTVHRVKEDILPGMRTFVKVSISRQKYNLQGNAINPMMNLNWKMYPREMGRNHPYVLES